MYANTNIQKSYQQNGVMTASPIELIIMLYEGAIKDLKLGKLHMEDKDYDKTNNVLIKAQLIIDELSMDLDMRYGISQPLLDLYTFMRGEIMSANIQKDGSKLDPIIAMLTELKDTWKEVKATNTKVFSRVEEI